LEINICYNPLLATGIKLSAGNRTDKVVGMNELSVQKLENRLYSVWRTDKITDS